MVDRVEKREVQENGESMAQEILADMEMGVGEIDRELMGEMKVDKETAVGGDNAIVVLGEIPDRRDMVVEGDKVVEWEGLVYRELVEGDTLVEE